MPRSLPLLAISDAAELRALLRVVLEAKFHPTPSDRELWASPLVHKLAVDISHACLTAEEQSKDETAPDVYREWTRSLPRNEALSTVKIRLREDASTSWWAKLREPEKINYLRGCIAPFETGEPFLLSLIQEAEA